MTDEELLGAIIERAAQRAAQIVTDQLAAKREAEPEWLTVAEAAEWLRVNPKLIYSRKNLPGRVKEGDRILIHRPTLRRALLADGADANGSRVCVIPVCPGKPG